MKEKIDTIPVNEAFEAGDECPFCYLERMAEQRVIRFTLGPGASYMETDVREDTVREGFCGAHLKKAYDYGNALGNGLILQTYMNKLMEELQAQIEGFDMPAKKPLFSLKKETPPEPDILAWAKRKQESCYVCNKVEYNMHRYFHTFFVLLKEPEFRQKVESSKGFCMRHFTRLLEMAPEELANAHRDWFYPTVMGLMRDNMARVKGDLDWFVGMFDYRQAGKDWKNSRDAVSRSMQKLRGIYPADPPYRQEPR